MTYKTKPEALRPMTTEAVVEAVARAICVACEDNPDHQGDARGNEFRWQDYRDAALAAISALAAQQPIDKARFERAPCYMCGYNGPGYYQPDKHPCAAKYHAALAKEDSND